MILSFSKLFFAILLGLLLFIPFVGFAVFLLLYDLLELFIGFWSSSCASYVLDSKFKLYTFVLSTYSSKGRLRNQVISILL
jgi:hypothetical protein